MRESIAIPVLFSFILLINLMFYCVISILESVWQRVTVCVFLKRHKMTVWLQITKQAKHMDPTIYMRQDHDLLEAIKYCFFFKFLPVNHTLFMNECTRIVISILYLIIFYLILLHAHKIIKTVVLIG